MGYKGKCDEDDRQALVVQAGYKSKWLQVDATLNSWGSGACDTRMKRAEKRYFENDILLVSEYVYLKEMYFGWLPDSQNSYLSGRFKAYTFQYRERSLLSKALNN